MPKTLLDWNLLFSYFYYGTLITVAILTILGLISESLMASRLGKSKESLLYNLKPDLRDKLLRHPFT